MLNDALFLTGLGLFTAGCYLMWPPLALLVPGAALMILGVVRARRGSGGD